MCTAIHNYICTYFSPDECFKTALTSASMGWSGRPNTSTKYGPVITLHACKYRWTQNMCN